MSVEPDHAMFAHIARREQVTYHDLARARRLLAKGWCQCASSKTKVAGFFFSSTSYCMTGAVAKAANDDLTRAIHMVRALFDVVYPKYDQPMEFDSMVCALQSWNDKDQRSQEDVLAVFDEAMVAIRYG